MALVKNLKIAAKTQSNYSRTPNIHFPFGIRVCLKADDFYRKDLPNCFAGERWLIGYGLFDIPGILAQLKSLMKNGVLSLG